jgi:tetratricopeptide (TPR) repeat protein
LGRESGRHDPVDIFEALVSSAGQAEWTPLFTDDFDRATLGESWGLISSEAVLTNGWMRLTAPENNDCYAVIKRAFPDNIRVEFEARFPSKIGYASDLACFLGGDEHTCDRNGYCLSFGADGNSCTRIQRETVDIRITNQHKATPGKIHSIAAEIIDGVLSLFVDGELILSYLDMMPLCGVKHDHLGLASYGEGAEFRNFRVLTNSGPTQASAFTIPDAYCRDGLFDRAIEKYNQIATTHKNGPLELLAQCKVALAMMGDQRWSSAEAQLRGLANSSKDTELESLVTLWHARTLGMIGKMDDALKTFQKVQSRTEDPGTIDETAIACGMLSQQLFREDRFIEAGHCSKFLFESIETPLFNTDHMFKGHMSRLHEAAMYEAQYQAVKKVGMAISSNRNEEERTRTGPLRLAQAAILTDRIDKARTIYDDLKIRSEKSGGDKFKYNLVGLYAELDMGSGEYAQALKKLEPLANSQEELTGYSGLVWGSRIVDLRACCYVLSGDLAAAISLLEAELIDPSSIYLRMILAAHLMQEDRKELASKCMDTAVSKVKGLAKFTAQYKKALLSTSPVEVLHEFIENSLAPSRQPMGMVCEALTLWSQGDCAGASVALSDSFDSAPKYSPAWHWAKYCHHLLQEPKID